MTAAGSSRHPHLRLRHSQHSSGLPASLATMLQHRGQLQSPARLQRSSVVLSSPAMQGRLVVHQSRCAGTNDPSAALEALSDLPAPVIRVVH